MLIIYYYEMNLRLELDYLKEKKTKKREKRGGGSVTPNHVLSIFLRAIWERKTEITIPLPPFTVVTDTLKQLKPSMTSSERVKVGFYIVSVVRSSYGIYMHSWT